MPSSEHIEIDFDGEFCPTPAETNAIVIWEELCTRYPKFWFGDPSLKASGNHIFGISATKNGKHPIGNVSIGEDLGLNLNEIPLKEDFLSVGQWRWALADPKSLDHFFAIMDCIYEGFHQFREGQTLQVGNRIEFDDVLDKDQATKKLHMRAAEILDVPYQRQFIVDLQAELNNPEFVKAKEPTDWRTYIVAEVREHWHHLDELGRLLIWISAMDRMKRENYG